MTKIITILSFFLISTAMLIAQPLKYSYIYPDTNRITTLFPISETEDLSIPLIYSRTMNSPILLFGTDIDEINSEPSTRKSLPKVAEDTATTSQIARLWQVNGVIKVEVSLVQQDVSLSLKVYNMLGKEVAEIYKGSQSTRTRIYDYPDTSLPNGLYICILTGQSFRDTEKFIVSR